MFTQSKFGALKRLAGGLCLSLGLSLGLVPGGMAAEGDVKVTPLEVTMASFVPWTGPWCLKTPTVPAFFMTLAAP
ncbi:MAG: hypothetical protein MH186_10950 [Marinobacter sp.]|nr:hypothetical protein [Marinobacter sp.]